MIFTKMRFLVRYNQSIVKKIRTITSSNSKGRPRGEAVKGLFHPQHPQFLYFYPLPKIKKAWTSLVIAKFLFYFK